MTAAAIDQAYAAVIGDLEQRARDAFAEGARIEAAIEALRALSGPAPSSAPHVPALPAPQATKAEPPREPAIAAPRPNARKFTDEQLRAAVTEGLTLVQMAQRFGCTPVAVSVRKRKLGLTGAALAAAVAKPAVTSAADQSNRPSDFDAALQAAMPELRRRALVLTRGNATEANDLMQDAAVKAMRSWSTFAPGTNFAGWMFTIMRNAFLTGKRRDQVRGPVVDPAEMPDLAVSGGQEAAVELGEALRAVDALPEEQRDAVVGAAVGQTLEENAKGAGVPVGTIKSRVSRAREVLRNGADDRAEIERFIAEKGVTQCPPSSTMRGAQLAAAVEQMRGRKRAPW